MQYSMHCGAYAILETLPPLHIGKGRNLVHQKATVTYGLEKAGAVQSKEFNITPTPGT